MGSDNPVSAVKVIGSVIKVHRASLSLRGSGGLSKHFRYYFVDANAPLISVPVTSELGLVHTSSTYTQ